MNTGILTFVVLAIIVLICGLFFRDCMDVAKDVDRGDFTKKIEPNEYLEGTEERSATRMLGAFGAVLFGCYIYVYICCILRGFDDENWPINPMPAWLSQVGAAISPGCHH